MAQVVCCLAHIESALLVTARQQQNCPSDWFELPFQEVAASTVPAGVRVRASD